MLGSNYLLQAQAVANDDASALIFGLPEQPGCRRSILGPNSDFPPTGATGGCCARTKETLALETLAPETLAPETLAPETLALEVC